MADTQRTYTQILALLADNTTGAISPQDLRDGFATLRAPHGQIYVAAADTASVTVTDTTSYFECNGPPWTLSGGGYLFDESAGNGRLTYTGTNPIMAMVTCCISMTAAASSQVTHWRLGVSGTTKAAAETQRKVGTSSDVGNAATTLLIELTNGQYISLFCRNATTASNLKIETAGIQIIAFVE